MPERAYFSTSVFVPVPDAPTWCAKNEASGGKEKPVGLRHRHHDTGASSSVSHLTALDSTGKSNSARQHRQNLTVLDSTMPDGTPCNNEHRADAPLSAEIAPPGEHRDSPIFVATVVLELVLILMLHLLYCICCFASVVATVVLELLSLQRFAKQHLKNKSCFAIFL